MRSRDQPEREKSSRYEQREREYSRSGHMNYKKNRFQTLSYKVQNAGVCTALYTRYIAKERERESGEKEKKRRSRG